MLFSYRKTYIFLLMSMLLGVICGTVLFNCLNDVNKNNLVIYYNYIVGRMNFKEICEKDYFIYVLLSRTKEIIFLIVLGLTSYRVLFHSAFLWYFGVKNSILIGLFTVAKGSTGALWYLLFTQPHMILYIIIIWYLIKKMDFEDFTQRKQTGIREIFKLIIAIIVLSLTECFINIFIMSKFI